MEAIRLVKSRPLAPRVELEAPESVSRCFAARPHHGDPDAPSGGDLLNLQKLAGNRAVVDLLKRWVSSGTVRGPELTVQRKVTKDLLDEANTILLQVAQSGHVIVVPRAMSVGTSDNPAICIKKGITLKWVKDQMGQPEISKDVAEDVNWRQIIEAVGIDTIVIHEGAFSGTKAEKSAVVWHEYGHIVHGASENGNVYLHEVTHLFDNRAALGENDVKAVVTRRAQSAYRKAVDPNRSELQAFLKGKWGIEI